MSDVCASAWQSAVFDVAVYPLTSARTLIELGFEPYPLRHPTMKVFFGCDTLFLPNLYSYVYRTIQDHGVWALYRGVEACAVRTFLFNGAVTLTFNLMRTHVPNMGGEPVRPNVKDYKLTHYESFRRRFRSLIRQTFIQTIAVVATQPLLVCMVREIAQHIRNETTYGYVHETLMKIGEEEGLPGLFAGLIPTLLSSYFCNWSLGAVGFVLDRFIWPYKKGYEPEDPQSLLRPKALSTIFIDKFLINPGGQRYRNVSRMMCVTGTSLKAATIPYAYSFVHWTEAFGFLRKENLLSRGCYTIFRVHYGAVFKDPKTQQLFATTSLRAF
ncbi:unnamed protein product [Bursaphelenchus okinawaensis]|uniref:Mitochondrial carrier protein n=1 Tax=Bursaphelenchus okinawaensis TaxID=465554 RepID=A0A811K1W3_9BILA|nr:unnamed protein product [Bursaphelenchus okinawaensis]CAG9089768.1 unnamed protein product [Bursaphelenchus okinawaensis]